MPYGYRKVRTFYDVTGAIEVDRHGSFGYFEIHNHGEDPVDIKVNEFLEQGHTGNILRIYPGINRVPLVLYKITTSEALDIIAYGL